MVIISTMMEAGEVMIVEVEKEATVVKEKVVDMETIDKEMDQETDLEMDLLVIGRLSSVSKFYFKNLCEPSPSHKVNYCSFLSHFIEIESTSQQFLFIFIFIEFI